MRCSGWRRLESTRGWRGTLLYGGESLGDTWIYSTNSELSDELCGNQLDDDGDALSDCDDPDCNGECCGYGAVCTNTSCQCPSGSTETACEDATDDDCDGLIDCADPDCDSSAYCSPEQDCADGNDNDSDGATDCADPGCAGVANCELRERSCDDGVDNDGDGLADCADMVDCYLSGSTIGCP